MLPINSKQLLLSVISATFTGFQPIQLSTVC